MDETTGQRSDRHRETILLRGMLIVAVGGLLIDAGIAQASSSALALVLIFALSNALLPFVPRKLIESQRFELLTGAGDLILVGLGIHLSGALGGVLPVSCLLMTLIMAIGHHRVSMVAGAAAIGALHAWLLLRTSPEVGIGRQLILQMLFLCSVGLYYGFMTQRSHRRRRGSDADDRRDGELAALLDILEATTSSQDLRQVGQSIVVKLTRIVPAVRCSIVQVNRDRTQAHVLVSHDDPGLDRLAIDLEKYPEISEALNSRSPVIVQDILDNPMMAGVRDHLKALEFRSLIVIPLTFGEEVMGALCVKAARVNQAFTRREIDFCVAVARATAHVMRNVRLHDHGVEPESRSGDVMALTPAQLRQLQAEKLSSIGDALSGVAHELNNPLCGVLGFSQLLLARYGSGTQAGDLEKIHASALRCQKIVKDLLSFTRGDSPVRKYLGLNGILEKTLDRMKDRLRTAEIEVVRDLQRELPRTMVDFHQMQQVFANLVDNALEAIAQVPGRRGRLHLSTSHREGMIRIEISDNGCGMTPEVTRKAFDPFFSTRKTDKRAGIGLSVAYGIISMHGGRIEAQGRPGEGATFILELPVVAAEREDGESREIALERPARGARILVVDDEPLVVDLLIAILEDLGHTVDTAQNGIEAFGKIGAHEYDLILTDIRMPRLNGMDLYRKLLARRPGMTHRVLFITADLIDQETGRFLQETGARALAKPLQVEEVVRAVQELLGSSDTAAVA